MDQFGYDAGPCCFRDAWQAGLDDRISRRVRSLATTKPHSPSTFRFVS